LLPEIPDSEYTDASKNGLGVFVELRN